MAATPPAWPPVDWTELLPPNDAPPMDRQRDLHLWLLLRRIMDWARVNDIYTDWRSGDREPAEYRRAMAPGRELDELLGLLDRRIKGTDRLEILGTALELSAWAESAGQPLVALRFAEAAAACDPFDPAPVNVAGRLSRASGLPWRADMWYSRGIGLARLRRWSACYVRAHIGYGALLKDVGSTERAIELFSRGSWRAHRSGIKWLAGEVTHDMLLLAISERSFSQAEEFAARAVGVYPRHHDRIPALVHDVGLLCIRRNAFDFAFSLLARVVTMIRKPHERLIACSTLAYSAAGAEEFAAYHEAQDFVLSLVDRYPACGPVTMVNLALAAQIRRDAVAAQDYARRALIMAGENPIHREAVSFALNILSGADEAPTPEEDSEQRQRALHPLFDACSGLVSRWRGKTWRERRMQTPAGAFGAA